MRRNIVHLFFLSLLALLCAGCPKQKTTPPTPEDTIAGSGYIDRSDYVFNQQAYRNSLTEEDIPVERDQAYDRGDFSDADKALTAVYYNFDNSSIQPSERMKVQEASKVLLDTPDKRFLVVGHCDWHGTTEYNLALGERRAQSVKTYLIDLGCDPNRIETLSKGDLEATARGKPSETARDRRSDIFVL